jgi:hypothetical protein
MEQAAVKLSPEILNEAGKYAAVYSRSVPLQIEHCARIGKIAEENPDLPYQFIENVLRGKADLDNGDVSVFEFRDFA